MESNAAAHKKRGLDHFPNELLHAIFDSLDSPAPSASKLRDEPVFELGRSRTADLKSVSRVCKLWRKLVLPLLFRHTSLSLQYWMRTQGSTVLTEVEDFVRFIRQENLSAAVCSFTLGLLNQEISDDALKPNLWPTIFEVIDPLDITIVAQPQVMGALTRCAVFMDDAWIFDMPYHILALSREPGAMSTGDVASSQSTDSTPGLLHFRPWTSVLLNEGSFIRAYSTYEYFLKCPPSILPHLVGATPAYPHALLPPSVEAFSYIAVFPFCTGFATLTQNFPKVSRFYMQITPRNDILHDSKQMAQVEARDLWMERNSCYALFIRNMLQIPLSGNYRSLKEFEYGDSEDEAAWQRGVQYVEQSGTGWKLDRGTVFVRKEIKKRKEGADNGQGGDGQPGWQDHNDEEAETDQELLSIYQALSM